MVTDEVETRRKVISQVFKNRYKKNKNSQETDEFDEDGEDEIEESDDE